MKSLIVAFDRMANRIVYPSNYLQQKTLEVIEHTFVHLAATVPVNSVFEYLLIISLFVSYAWWVTKSAYKFLPCVKKGLC